MRKISKLLLTLALLVFAVGGAKAERVYANLSQYGDKWDGTDVTFSWNATWGNQLGPNLDAIGLPKGDLRSWQKLVVVVDELKNCDFFRVLVYNGDDNGHNNTFKCTKTGANEFTLSGNVDYLNKVTRICLSGSNNEDSKNGTWGTTPASFKVKEVYLERPDVITMTEEVVYDAPDGSTALNGMTGEGSIKWTVTYPKELGPTNEWLGSIDNENQSVNITNYDYLYFIVSSVETGKKLSLRVFVSSQSSNNNDYRKCLYPHPIAEVANVLDWEAISYINTPGTYVVKISDYPLLRGFKAGNGWNGDESNGKITVSLAYLTANSVVPPTSRVVTAGEEALTDPTALCFDVTALPGSGRTLNAANPNALFIANDGTLANTKNVIVSGVCDNLDLTDGYPFKAPSTFTANNAKFTKTFTNAKCGTMVIPFAADLPSGIEAYNLTGDDGTTITHTDAASIAANAPVLLKSAAATDYEFTATSVNIAATVDESTNGKLIGTYGGTTAVAGANNYVLQNGAEGLGFFKVTGIDATVKPFRAYLNTDALASQLVLDFGDVTGINAAELVKKVGNETFYNLNGQRVAQPAKGLYIVNGKKVIFK